MPTRTAIAFAELRTTFNGRSYVPDVSIYLWDRVPSDPDGEVSDEFYTPPDVAFEIVSPRQSLATLTRRCRWMVQNSVQAAVLVNPRDKSIRLFRPNQIPPATLVDQAIDLTAIIPGLRLGVDEIFALLKVR